MSTAVLLLHGIGGGCAIWARTVSALRAAGLQAEAIDLPGYGQHAAQPAGMDGFVAAAQGAIARLAAPRTVLVGHSMGGMVAQELLARHPRAVQGLVLACTSASFGAGSGAWQQRFIAERTRPLDEGLGMAGMAALLVPALVSPAAGDDARRIAGEVMSRVPEATYRAALAAIAAFDRREALASIAVPTLVLAAEHDRTAPPEMMQRMAARIPGARYACLPAAGHIANVEAPAAFDAALIDFISTLTPCTSPATRKA